MQSPSCADGCLAGDVYLDIVTMWSLLQSARLCRHVFYTIEIELPVNTAMAHW